MSKFDKVIKNGTIVTASDTYKGDLGIKDGIIAEIGQNLECDTVIDAAGKLIIPGGIDAHTHLDMPFGGTFSSDDFESGSKAAAIGGTTSFIDYSIQPAGGTLADAVKIWKEKGAKSCVDYGLHVAITKADENALAEIPTMVKEGITSFKVFMVYDAMRVNDAAFMNILEKSKEHGALVGVHCENYHVINHRTKQLLEAGKTEPKYHAVSRPATCEGEAANRAITLAKLTNAPLYIVHNSCEESISRVKEAREAGLPIMGETCPQYVMLSEDNYDEPGFNGAKYVMSPPLRSKKNWDYIWQQLKDGVIQTVATDHCPFFMKQKELGKDDFTKIPNGGPGIETRMAIMLSEGPKHGLSLNKVVEVTSTNVAKIFGMYPKKGTIAVGSDADLVLYDANKEVTITKDVLHENVDYTAFEGVKVSGYPVMTLSRGDVVAKDGEYIGESNRGQFIKRGKSIVL
ncbi:dihydropyrimidinase [Terrisporobacter mayombei]|uniref:D-hydantoinase n=1 Tax=Terrisporobacter mayombei TaxID=1541 RepID=A0ABY9PY91_9FIRM|nr:dihydropyrimidinase [Terrisporobacter mayombei]MCC3867906.1 dihydropyrimidinase [Terrisporobacter mayombei]WMT80040.1 D-hydantoinase [Terrisporobacter mayombei]